MFLKKLFHASINELDRTKAVIHSSALILQNSQESTCASVSFLITPVVAFDRILAKFENLF